MHLYSPIKEGPPNKPQIHLDNLILDSLPLPILTMSWHAQIKNVGIMTSAEGLYYFKKTGGKEGGRRGRKKYAYKTV